MKDSETKKKKEKRTDNEKGEINHEKEIKRTSFSIPVLPALLGIILVLGFAVGVLLNRTCPEVQSEFTSITCPKCPTISQGLELLYLMPINCTTCDFRMVQSISNDLNFLIKPYVTDSVQSPMLFIGTKNKATLALANSRYNILTAICEFANEKNACLLKDRESTKNKEVISGCLDKYNISSTSVVFLYSDTCPHCARMKPLVRNLENQSYNFTWINVQDAEKMAIAKDCLLNVLDVRGYVPQFACPITKELKVGVFASIEKMKEFADRCKNASSLNY
ncbi:MAG: hypothetical protein QXY62_01285 [Candidatus Altiarchaeota archaeon]